MYLLSDLWNFAVLSDLFWKIFKVCNSTDETISIWIVGTYVYLDTGRRPFLLIPRYKARIARSFIFIIPILLMVIPPKTPEESGMAGYDDNGVFSSIKETARKKRKKQHRRLKLVLRMNRKQLQIRQRYIKKKQPQEQQMCIHLEQKRKIHGMS